MLSFITVDISISLNNNYRICGIYDQEEMTKSLKGNNPEFINDSVEYVRHLKQPRLIKTHLPFSLLPLQIQNNTKQPKVKTALK